MRNSKTAYYRFLDEIVDILGCDAGQWYSFYPLGKIVNSDYRILEPSNDGEWWVNYFDFSLDEGPKN